MVPTVHFELPSALNRYTDGCEHLQLRGSTVGQVLESLFEAYPPYKTRILDSQHRLFPYLLMFLNGEELSRDSLLQTSVDEGDHLELIAAAEGGQQRSSAPI